MALCAGVQRPRRRSRKKAVILAMVLAWVIYTMFFGAFLRRHGEEMENKIRWRMPGTWLPQATFPSSTSNSPSRETIPRALVVASTRNDDTSWLYTHLPDWRKSIYVVDDRNAGLTVPLNKGRESMAYLTLVGLVHTSCQSWVIDIHQQVHN